MAAVHWKEGTAKHVGKGTVTTRFHVHSQITRLYLYKYMEMERCETNGKAFRFQQHARMVGTLL